MARASSTPSTASAIATTSRRGRRRRSATRPTPPGRGGRGGRGQGAPGARPSVRAPPIRRTARCAPSTTTRTATSIWSTSPARPRPPITTDGSAEKRIKYGTASWVYGEELDQITAMWWSPDSRKLAFYRFDESGGPRLLPAARSDQAAEHGRHRGLPEGRRAESGRRSADLRRRLEKDDEGRRPRRQALHQRRRRPLRLSRELDARTARSCCSTAPTAGRTSSRWSPPSRRAGKCASCFARSGRPAGSRTARPRCS